MKKTIAAKQIFKYLIDTFPGSFIDTVSKRQPRIEENEFVADLHCHPNIKSLDDLYHTVGVCKKNNVGLIAIVQHYRGANPHDSDEYDYWQVLDLIERNERDLDLEITNIAKDKLSFEIEGVKFIGGYEFYGCLDGVDGRLDLVPIMTEKGFKEEIKEGESVEELLKICQGYGAIKIGAHPYTLWSPWGPFNKIPFRLANEDERKNIRDNLFPSVDTVDLVAANTLWMLESNELVRDDYNGKPLYTSDTHAKSRSARKEIGRAGSIFKSHNLAGEELREDLREDIEYNRFRHYINYMPFKQFLLSVAS